MRRLLRCIRRCSAIGLLVLPACAPRFVSVAGADAPRSRLVTAGDGTTVEYFTYGNGAETIVMVAGNGRTAMDLHGIALRVAHAGLRVVLVSHRGIGGSVGPLETATLHDLAGDVWRVADALRLERVHLLGKTFGQRIMRTASADQPDRVLSLIALAAGGEIPPGSEVVDAYRRMRTPGIAPEEWLRLSAFANFAPGNADKARLGVGGSVASVATAQLSISDRTPTAEWALGGTAPMLILQGLEDKVAVPQNAINLATRRPNSWLVGLPNCGHNMVFEQPDEIAVQIVAFVRNHARR